MEVIDCGGAKEPDTGHEDTGQWDQLNKPRKSETNRQQQSYPISIQYTSTVQRNTVIFFNNTELISAE